MIGKATSLLLTAALAVAAILYSTSFKTRELEEDLGSINRKIVAEYDKIQVLKAEWALLNDPERIERLAKAHLALRPADPRQFAEVATLPTRRADEAPTPVAAVPVSASVVIDGRSTRVPLPAVKPATQPVRSVAQAPRPLARTESAAAPRSRDRDDGLGSMIARLDTDRRATR